MLVVTSRPGRVYPVEVDPSIHLMGGRQGCRVVRDTVVTAGYTKMPEHPVTENIFMEVRPGAGHP